MIFILYSFPSLSVYSIAQFLLSIVIPLSLSSGFESIIRPCCPPASLLRSSVLNIPDWYRSWSTSVVLPWSTCAIIATFLM